VSTLSLWHGDYELGPDCLKSEHQHHLKALLQLAYESRDSATMINGALRSLTLSGVGDRVAATVCYPYLDDEIFYRYCALTGAIMSADVAALLPEVRQPTLVVTSQDDHTAHPAGSIEVARRLPRARLQVEPHGDHLSVFAATPRLRQIQRRFLAEVSNEVSV
jgi:pimeloyl-ACP methyl ester carboxylesterase